MVGMAITVAKEVTTTEALEETLGRTLAADLKAVMETVAAQGAVVVPATEALEANLVATQPEDRMVLAKMVPVKEVMERIVEAARVVPTKEVRIRVPRDKAKMVSPDALEQLVSTRVSRLRLEA